MSEHPDTEYIFFLDEMDYIGVDYVRLLEAEAESTVADMVFADLLCHDGETEFYYNLEPARYEQTFSDTDNLAKTFRELKERSICWKDLRGKLVSYGLLAEILGGGLQLDARKREDHSIDDHNRVTKKKAIDYREPADDCFDNDDVWADEDIHDVWGEISAHRASGKPVSYAEMTEYVFEHVKKAARAEHAFCFLYDARKKEEKGYYGSIVTPVGEAFYEFKKLKKQIVSANTSLVSFDVFDTLITRNVLEPYDVFRLMNREFNVSIGSSDFVSFSEIRRSCEASCRERMKKVHPDYEDVNLDEIYEEIEVQTVYERELLEEMKLLEISLEHKVCRRRNVGYELYRLAVEAGKEIIFVSDMYLPKAIVARLLSENGYSDDIAYTGLYIS